MSSVELKEIRKGFGATQVVKGVSLSISSGEFLVLVGPSGCGKTTLLRLMAGLDTPDAGDIAIGGRRVNDVPPRDRDVAMVFQSYALYPHLTVRENLAFGLTLRKLPKAEIDARVNDTAEQLALTGLLDRKPKQLSGGQRQRVAMGRAIVRRPSVFLFDEPLSNLDTALRVQMRGELMRLHRDIGATMIYVTHDQVEAMTLATRVAVFNLGVLQQVGPPLELYQRPANRFVAGFLGSPSMNFVPAVHETGTLQGQGFRLTAPQEFSTQGEVLLGIRPQELTVSADGPFSGSVQAIERLGFDAYAFVTTAAGPMAARFDPLQPLSVGDNVRMAPKGSALHLFSADGSTALRHPTP